VQPFYSSGRNEVAFFEGLDGIVTVRRWGEVFRIAISKTFVEVKLVKRCFDDCEA